MAYEQRDARPLTRRTLLRSAAGTGVAAATGPRTGCRSANRPDPDHDAPLETTTIRMSISPLSCFAAHTMAVDFLKQDGFTDVQLLRIEFAERVHETLGRRRRYPHVPSAAGGGAH